MTVRWFLYALFSLLLFPLSADEWGEWGEQPAYSFSGYGRSTVLLYRYPERLLPVSTVADRPFESLQTTARLRFFSEPSDLFSAEIAWQLSPFHHADAIASLSGGFMPEAAEKRVADFPDRIAGDYTQGISHALDRFTVTFSPGFGDFIIGRQAITFGSAKFIQPTDIFSPFAFQDLNTEHKTGVDAVRFRLPVGDMNEIDAGVVFGRRMRMKNNAFFLRGRMYVLEKEVTLTVTEYNENLMVAADIAGSLFDAGFWVESSYTLHRLFAGNERDMSENFFRMSAGVDYKFENGIYLFMEYHVNTAGAFEPRGYAAMAVGGTDSYFEAGGYLFGRQYAAPGVQWEITPLLTGTVQTLMNLRDPSGFVNAVLSWNAAQNTTVDAGAFIGFGRSPGSGSFLMPFTMRSEFGTYPDMVYLRCSVYF